MKAVIQRVKNAKVIMKDKSVGEIAKGILIFICIEKGDTYTNADYLADKIINLRIFENGNDKMNLSVKDIAGELLVVSQFTLSGNCDKGRRPSFEKVASPKIAEELYSYFVKRLKKNNLKVESGIFRTMMEVQLINDGPATFIIETQNRDN
jgi:D-tyrosyl-tRNA(Tyr) deacylase